MMDAFIHLFIQGIVTFITACAIATSCCISDVPKSMGKPKIRPPLLPHFATDLYETQNQERYPGHDFTCKIWLMWDDGKGVCIERAFSVTFCVLSFFEFLFTPIQVTPEDRSRPFMAQNACFRVS